MSFSSSSSSDFGAPPDPMAGEGGARAAAAGAAAAAAAAADSSDDDASREMNVNDVQIDPKLSIDGSPIAAAAAVAAAAVSPKRDIASVGPTSNEPPTKKVATADFDAATDDDKPDTSNDEAIAQAMQHNGVAAPASAVPGGTINDMPKCDPTFADRVNLDPVPSIKPLPKLSHRDIAELELVSSTLAPSVVS